MPLYIRRFKHYFPDCSVRDVGLLCSEGRGTIPLKDFEHGGVLSVQTAFFEFINEKDLEKENPKIYLCNELIKDESYCVIITTSSGFYRYNLNDIVKITGFYNKTPILEFLHRGENVASITGEKLTEWQVVNAMHSAAEKLNFPIYAFTAAIKWAKTPYYEMIVELHEKVDETALKKFLGIFEDELKILNCEYKEKRDSLRLESPVLKIVKPGSYDEYVKHKIALGSRDSQIKLPCLVQQLGFEKNFTVIHEVGLDKEIKNAEKRKKAKKIRSVKKMKHPEKKKSAGNYYQKQRNLKISKK